MDTRYPNGLNKNLKYMAHVDGLIKNVIASIQPSQRSEIRRLRIVDFIQKIIKETLGGEALLCGSFAQKTYLPDGDIDLSLIKCVENPAVIMETWVMKLNQAICSLAIQQMQMGNKAEFSIRNLQFINSQVRVLKCTIDNVAVDITYRQAGSMAVSLLMESADRHFGKDHLFKKSVLLVKAWCVHESPKYNGQVVLGSNHFALSTYAVNIMILAVLNGPSGAHITTPFQSLIGFFETFGNFDWTG